MLVEGDTEIWLLQHTPTSEGSMEILYNCEWIIQPIYSGCGCCLQSARLPVLWPCISMAGLEGGN